MILQVLAPLIRIDRQSARNAGQKGGGEQPLNALEFDRLVQKYQSLVYTICRQLVVLIPAAWLLSRTGEVNMVWWAFIIAEVVSLALSLVFMARINRTVIVPLSEKQDAAV